MDTDQYSSEETARRVKAAIKGAFSGLPTPLKDIPKRNGESRHLRALGKADPQRKKRKKK